MNVDFDLIKITFSPKKKRFWRIFVYLVLFFSQLFLSGGTKLRHCMLIGFSRRNHVFQLAGVRENTAELSHRIWNRQCWKHFPFSLSVSVTASTSPWGLKEKFRLVADHFLLYVCCFSTYSLFSYLFYI